MGSFSERTAHLSLRYLVNPKGNDALNFFEMTKEKANQTVQLETTVQTMCGVVTPTLRIVASNLVKTFTYGN